MATITVNKCEKCEALFEDKEKYGIHIDRHAKEDAFNAKYPEVENEGCEFGNGKYSVQRTEEWFGLFIKDMLKEVESSDISYAPFSYGWFRSLQDGGHWQYSLAYRWQCICNICFKEWGQPYYANHCSH